MTAKQRAAKVAKAQKLMTDAMVLLDQVTEDLTNTTGYLTGNGREREQCCATAHAAAVAERGLNALNTPEWWT